MAEEKIVFLLSRQEAEIVAYILHTYQEPLRPDDDDSPTRQQAIKLGNFIAEKLTAPSKGIS